MSLHLARYVSPTFLALAAVPAVAGITAVGGSVVVVVPPSSVQGWKSDSEARIWHERASVSLPVPLQIDALNSGLVFGPGATAQPGVLQAGVAVDSYLLRVDPATTTGLVFEGWVEFDRPVLGVMFSRNSLEASDPVLALPGVTLNHNADRGLEIHAADPTRDRLWVSPDRRRVEIDLLTFTGTDDVRIVTASVACRPDITSNAIPGTPGYLVPDGVLNNDDFFAYVIEFAAGNLAVADLTTTAIAGQPGYGVPNGVITNDDFFYYLILFAQGC